MSCNLPFKPERAVNKIGNNVRFQIKIIQCCSHSRVQVWGSLQKTRGSTPHNSLNNEGKLATMICQILIDMRLAIETEYRKGWEEHLKEQVTCLISPQV
jgi:hypothetical protein